MAESVVGKLIYLITGDKTPLEKQLNESKKAFLQYGKDLENAGRKLSLAVSLPILGIGAAALKASADMEMQTAAFETLLGSAEKARDLLEDLKDLAAKTPFQMTDLSNATKTMLSFGIAQEEVLPNLRMLGDIAQGDSVKLKSLTLAFSQIQSTGRLMGQDLLQLINAGFNPLQIISEQTGKSMAVLKDEMAQGAISAAQVAEAFKIATSEGGLFYGGMEKASQTLAGQWSTLKDNAAELGRELGEVLLPIAKDIVSGISGMVQKFSDMDDRTKKTIITVAGLAAAVGPLVLILGKGFTVASNMIKAYQTMRVVMQAVTLLHTKETAAQAVATAAKIVGTKATAGMTVATRALAAAQSALPIMAVVAALAALAGVIGNAIKKTREQKDATEQAAQAYDDYKTQILAQEEEIPKLISVYESLSDKQNRSVEENRILQDTVNRLNEIIPGVTDEWGINTLAIEKYNDAVSEQSKVLRDEVITEQEKLRDRLEKNYKLWAATGWGALAFGQLDKVKAQIEEVDQTINDLNKEAIAETTKKMQEQEAAFRAVEMSVERQKEGQEDITDEIEEQLELEQQRELLNKTFDEANAAALDARIAKINQANTLLDAGLISELEAIEKQRSAYVSYVETITGLREGYADETSPFVVEAVAAIKEMDKLIAKYKEVGNLGRKAAEGVGGAVKDLFEKQRTARLEAKELQIAMEDAGMYGDQAFHDLGVTIDQELVDKMSVAGDTVAGVVTEMTNSLTDLVENTADAQVEAIEALLEAELEAVDEELAAALKAAGVAEETELESLQTKLNAAIASGDAETQAELEDDIERLKITEEYEAKKTALEEAAARESALLEYEAELTSWRLKIVSAIADAAAAIVSIWSTWAWNPIVAGALTGTAGFATAVQIAAIKAAKPAYPTLAEGGIAVDPVAAIIGDNPKYAEAVLPLSPETFDQLAESIVSAMSANQDVGGGTIHLQVYLDSRPFMEKIFPATKDGIVKISARAVV